jgi:hypothetical protein
MIENKVCLQSYCNQYKTNLDKRLIKTRKGEASSSTNMP